MSPEEAARHWLLPQPETTEVPGSGFLRNDELDEGAIVDYLSGVIGDAQVRLQAFGPDGLPLVPPEAHVRDHLARANNLVDEELQLSAFVQARTVWVVSDSWPETCLWCGEPARYDAIITTPQRHGGAFVYVAHARPLFSELGDDDTGAVYLMRDSEVPAHIRAEVDARRRELGRA